MYELLRRWTLAVLKAPPEPRPPIGDPASLRVFRAGQNYFRLRMTRWVVAELVALAGLIFWTTFLIDIDGKARVRREERANQPATAATPAEARERRKSWEATVKENIRAAATKAETKGKGSKKGKAVNSWAGFKQGCVELAALLPSGVFMLVWGLKIFGMLVYLVQIPITYAVRRLDYEMRWYMVTDRSLRLRHGVWRIFESTMSFANIQEVVVSQGPLQRLLGLGDVKVKSAGGGGGGSQDHHGSDMHTGLFHSVTNATEIRDLILDRLRRFHEAGLGDPDEKLVAVAPAAMNVSALSSDALSAARELAAEARALRVAVETTAGA